MKNKPADIAYAGFNVNAERVRTAQPIPDPEAVELFQHFVLERHTIYQRRVLQRQLGPWTDDAVLDKNRFTNVFRTLDRETANLITYIIADDRLTYADRVLNIMLFRMWNLGSTFSILGGPWKVEDFKEPETMEVLLDQAAIRQAAMSKDHAWYTSAFMVSGLVQALQRSRDQFKAGTDDFPAEWEHRALLPLIKAHEIVHTEGLLDTIVSLGSAAVDQVIPAHPAQTFDWLNTIDGFGPFLAYQMWVDMSYMADTLWSENEFVVAGPGCIKGLQELFGQNMDGLTPAELVFWVRDHQHQLFQGINLRQAFWDRPPDDPHVLDVMALENCFCEFSKYMRLRRGQTIKVRPFDSTQDNPASQKRSDSLYED